MEQANLFADLAPAARLSGAERLARLRLARSHRVGPQTFLRLLVEHGSAAEALAALPEVAAAAGVRRYSPCPVAEAERELALGTRSGAKLICWGEEAYPALLARIPDPPPVLWLRGALPARTAVALVGARNASALGQRMAGHLARSLGAAEVVTISGLARGIDTAVHRASLASGTVAVLAGGLECIYPSENADLAAEIPRTGALLSEMPPGLQPQARHFPRRNRIISGLAQALVVIEGAAKSGSLITATAAADQGREIMAVPGHPFDARAAGCNMLIRDGATLVRSADDILAALSPVTQRNVIRPVPAAAPTPAPAAPRPVPPSGPVTQHLMNLLGPAPIAEDALIRQIGHPPEVVLAALTELDLTGRIQRHPGGLVSAAVG